jgi:molybdopterin molybdotransferase
MSNLPDYDDALAEALRSVAPLESQAVALELCSGRVLAETVVTDRDLPPFNRAQMDGYALRAAEFEAGRDWPVVDTVPAGVSAAVDVPPGSCVAIATGAPLPPSVDTVIQHELSDRANPVRFSVDTIDAGHAVHPRGADASAGETVLEPGMCLAAHHIGIAMVTGRTTLDVHRRPRAALLTSGDEVIDETGGKVETHQVRNSNRLMVMELLTRFGAVAAMSRHLPDDRDVTIDAVGAALADHDLVVTVGGVSAGERDHFPAAFETHDVRQRLQGAAIQPGKPVRVGGHGGGATVIALPGNPVSALACACIFIWPVVRTMLGLTAPLPWRPVTLTTAVKPNPRRRAFRPAVLDDATGAATVPPWAGSGDLAHTAPTRGLVELPVQNEPVPAGTTVRFLPWPGSPGT